MEQFLTGDIWKHANKFLNKRNSNSIACIAYFSTNKLLLNDRDIVICNASRNSIQSGQTSAKSLQYYYKKGITIFSNPSLHSKLLLTNEFLLIGSANLSKSSAEVLIESAVISNSKILIAQTRSFCYILQEDSKQLTDKDIEELLKIPVIRKKTLKVSASPARRKKFSNKHWFIIGGVLSEKVQEDLRKKTDKSQKQLADNNRIKEDSIGYLRWPINTSFSKNVKPGDQFIYKLINKQRKRASVYCPATVLKKEKIKNHLIIYYYETASEETGIGWTAFKKTIGKLKLSKPIGERSVALTQSDSEKLTAVWEK